MKKVIALFAALALALIPVSFAGTYETECSPNGCGQGVMVTALYNHQVAINDVITNTLNGDLVTELKTDHDADNSEFALAVIELAELKLDHDADNGIVGLYKIAINAFLSNGMLQTNGILIQQPVLAVGATAGKANMGTILLANLLGTQVTVAKANDYCDATALTDIVNDYEKVLFSVGTAGTCVVTQGVGAVSQIAATYPAVPAGEVIIGGLEIGDGGAHDYNVATLTDDGGTFITPKVVAAALVASPVAVASVAADLAAANPTGFAADCAEVIATGTVVGATSYGTGTVADPLVKIVD